MKITKIWMMAVAMLAFTACEEHIEPVDLSLKVGNVYREDGSIVPPEHHKQQGDEAPMPIGILVAVGGQDDDYTGLVMALEDLPDCYWFSAMTAETEAGTETEAFNGKQNTTTLLSEYAENSSLDPMGAIMAGTYQAGNITGWHLPAVAEMKEVVKNIGTVNRTIRMLGSQQFSDEWYLTSTVDGASTETAIMYNYCIIMPEGRVVSELKTEKHRVRPFMIIR